MSRMTGGSVYGRVNGLTMVDEGMGMRNTVIGGHDQIAYVDEYVVLQGDTLT